MNNSDEYNGWVNRETWATALHLSNDEGLYRECVELVANEMAHGHSMVAAGEAIAEFVSEFVQDPVFHTDTEVAPHWARLMASDVGSFYRVDWTDVAESFNEDT